MEKIVIHGEFSDEEGYDFGFSGKPEGMTDMEYQQGLDSLMGAVVASAFHKRANGDATIAKALTDAFANSVKAMLESGLLDKRVEMGY